MNEQHTEAQLLMLSYHTFSRFIDRHNDGSSLIPDYELELLCELMAEMRQHLLATGHNL